MIRKAVLADFDKVYAFSPMMATQAIFEYEPRLVAAEVLSTIQAGNCLVAETDGEIIGTAGYDVFQPLWYSSQHVLGDKWIAVLENHRGSFAAGRLIIALEEAAAKLGVPFMPAVGGSQQYAPTFTKRYGDPVAVIYKKAS